MTATDKKKSRNAGHAAELDALSPRRLAILTGAFISALAVLLIAEYTDSVQSRRTETALRLDQAVSTGADAMNIAIMTGEPVRNVLKTAWPGGQAALYHLSSAGDILSTAGLQSDTAIDPALLRSLELNRRGAQVLDLPGLQQAVSWRPLDNGDVLLAAAPAGDIYARTPAFVVYGVIFLSMGLVVAALMAAFLRQSRAAAGAADALTSLEDIKLALSGGRCSPWFYDKAGRQVTLSRSLLEPLGLGARDRRFSMREVSALVHPEDLRTAIAIISGEPSAISEGAVRLRTPGGDWSTILLRTAADASRLSRAGVAFDLATSAPLTPIAAIAETRLRDAIESIPEAFVLWDAQGRLAVWNRRFAGIFAIPSKVLEAGLTVEEVATVAGVAGDLLIRQFGPLKTGESKNVEVALPGSRWAHVSRRPTAEGGCVCIAANVTDLKRRARAQKTKERELQRTVADLEASRRELSEAMQKYQYEKYRAEEASRSKSEFLANMSHELRTPLNAINGFSEIMESELYGPLGDDKYKEYVQDILSSGRHLLELIDDVLDMSRIEAGRLKLEPKRIELERTLNESVRLVAKRASDAGVKLTVSIGHAPPIFADNRAVKQVTLNLLSNSIKFTPAGGEITLTAEADLDGVTIIVADSGPGMSHDQLQKLGSPFETVNSQSLKSSAGTGLGLALSKSLMEMQGGMLALASQPGKGTVACATFPRRKGAKVRLPQFIVREAHILTKAQPASPAVFAAPKAAE
ncbi:MAG: ATP-binding protein [Pseudomonadota bacterium]